MKNVYTVIVENPTVSEDAVVIGVYSNVSTAMDIAKEIENMSNINTFSVKVVDFKGNVY